MISPKMQKVSPEMNIKEHDAELKRFLYRDLIITRMRDSLESKLSKELLEMLRDTIPSKGGPVQYKTVASALTIDTSHVPRLKNEINQALRQLCDGWDIDPPVQLYFRTRTRNVDTSRGSVGNANIGAHFACCRTGCEHVSGSLVPIDRLKAMLNRTLERIQNTLLDTSSFKYLRHASDMLNVENRESRWFRKTGPIAVDLEEGKVWSNPEGTRVLREYGCTHSVCLVVGSAGTGKSVLVRQYAHECVSTSDTSHVYHYSFKSDLPVDDWRRFQEEIGRVAEHGGVVIVEDIHLAVASMQNIVRQLKRTSNGCIILTTRPSFESQMLGSRPDDLERLPRLTVEPLVSARSIVEYYASKVHAAGFEWTSEMKESIESVAGGNLWLLSYALAGCTGKGDPSSWVRTGVISDLRDLANPQGANCRPEILLSLCPLYAYEVPTAQSFLVRDLGYDYVDVERLVAQGEIVAHLRSDQTFYGLPHSSLALAYWEHGRIWRDMVKYDQMEEFIYHYMVSGMSNTSNILWRIDRRIWVDLLDRLRDADKARDVVRTSRDAGLAHWFGQFLYVVPPPFALSTYYHSPSFMRFFAKALFERKDLHELHPSVSE